MKKIIFSLVLILATFTTFAQQNGGDVSNIKLKNSAGTKDDVWRTGHSQNTYDTAVAVWLSPLKLKTDSIYTKLMSSLAVTGTFWQATQPVSLDSATQRKMIKVSELPAITGTVTSTLDSNTQRRTIKVSELPSITIANTAFTANAGTNLNTSLLALSSKQPSIGVSGTPSSDVITIQGVSGMQPVKVDGSAVTQPISVAAPTTIYNGKKTVTTAGARVQLASSQAVRSVCIKALQTNTGYIYVGDGSVTSTTGIQLLAGDTISLDISNLSTVTIDSSVSGEGVTYIATN